MTSIRKIKKIIKMNIKWHQSFSDWYYHNPDLDQYDQGASAEKWIGRLTPEPGESWIKIYNWVINGDRPFTPHHRYLRPKHWPISDRPKGLNRYQYAVECQRDLGYVPDPPMTNNALFRNYGHPYKSQRDWFYF